jgi:hypothetical protein
VPDDTAGEGNGLLPSPAVVRAEGAPGFNVIKLYASDGAPTSEHVGRAGFSNHSPSVSGPTSSMQGDASARVISVAWIESAPGDSSGVGRVMWQRFTADLAPANDNATSVAELNDVGALGCEPAVAGLAGGETLVTWIGADGTAHGRLYPPDDFSVNGEADAAYAAVNASLAELGPTAHAPDGGRRLQVTETRPGNLAVMWLALADHGFVVRGSMFSTPLAPSTDGDSDGGLTATPIAEVRLPPGFAGAFSLQGAGDGSADVIVRYTDASGNVALVRRIDVSGSDGEVGRAGPEFVADSELAAQATAPDVRTALAGPASPEEGVHAETPQAAGDQTEPVSLMLDMTDALEGEPIVTATQGGFAVTWQELGTTEDAVAIRIAMFDANGVPRPLPDGSTVITIADNALAAVKPSVVDVDSGIAAAYVDADEGSLVVKAYDDGGTLIGQDVVDDGASGGISEISLGSSSSGDTGEENELAVVYVRDDHDDQPDYGSIMLQRYRLPGEGDSDGLVALGGDGETGGNDAPVALTNEPDADPTTCEDVQGRAPSVTGLDHGELAIVWVENDGARETIRGRVLEAGGGQVLQIDLTGLLQDSGIARGTEPILLANADGDILVSWLQRNGEDDDAYVVMAALYEAAGENQWIAPELPMRLQSFDEEPKDFFVTWSDSDGSAIDVTWRADSSGSGSGKGLLSQRFDLDGNDVGKLSRVPPADGDQISTEGLSAAGLVNGQIVVVYAEQGKRGDLDLAAHVVDTQIGDTSTVEISDQHTAVVADVVTPAEAFSTGVDQEIAIDLATAAGAAVSHINGLPITTAEPVDVGAGWIQLRDDGWLTVSPDAGYAGPIAFDYTIGGVSSRPDVTSHVTVNVAKDAPSALALGNQTTGLAEDVSTAADIKLAEIDVSEADVSTANLSLAGLDADLFKIVGNTLYLKAGVDLDFDSNPKLSVEIRPNGSATQDQAVNFTLDVKDTNGSAAPHDYLAADTFVFAPEFGEGDSMDAEVREVIDMSSSAYSTFQELLDSGALMQSGEDVVITFDPTDPGASDKITLRGIELSVLTSADFKF